MSETKAEASEGVIFSWDWEKQQYLRAERDLSRARLGSRRAFLVALLSTFALTGTIGFFLLGLRGALVVGGVATAFAVTGGWAGSRVEWRLKAWRFARKCLPKYSRTEAEVTKSRLTLKNIDSRVELEWSVFQRWAESEEFFLLYHGKAAGYFLPKAAVTSGEVELTRRFLSEAVTPRPQPDA